MSTSGKALITPEKIDTQISLLLPQPNIDMRTLKILYADNNNSKVLDFMYETDISKDILSINGKVLS